LLSCQEGTLREYYSVPIEPPKGFFRRLIWEIFGARYEMKMSELPLWPDIAYSGTWINQQWPSNPETPHGAWEFPEHLIPNSPAKPIRIWMEVGDFDLLNPNVMRDNMHDWVVANENLARALATKHYHYQFVFARNAGNVDHATKLQTLPEALEYVWQDYHAPSR
jgi:iron(III)-enterobactin esterase